MVLGGGGEVHPGGVEGVGADGDGAIAQGGDDGGGVDEEDCAGAAPRGCQLQQWGPKVTAVSSCRKALETA